MMAEQPFTSAVCKVFFLYFLLEHPKEERLCSAFDGDCFVRLVKECSLSSGLLSFQSIKFISTSTFYSLERVLSCR